MTDDSRSDEALALELLERIIKADPDLRQGDHLVTDSAWVRLSADEQYLWRRLEARAEGRLPCRYGAPSASMRQAWCETPGSAQKCDGCNGDGTRTP